MKIRVGTRGSDLALWQTRYVCRLLAEHHLLECEEVIIRTHAEDQPTQSISPDIWPTGGFVGEIERALAAGEIDLAVHSYKDLPSVSPEELTIAAVPPRGPMHDRLIARDARTAERMAQILAGERSADSSSPPLRIGTSSPRRAAQLKRVFGATSVGLRGNVPTRLRKLHDESHDAVCLAAAGLVRLGLEPDHAVDLPLDRFPTAPGQGAIAAQVRRGGETASIVSSIDDRTARRAVTAERSFLATIEAGCHTPLGASARLLPDDSIELRVQLFSADDAFHEAVQVGNDPAALGEAMAREALKKVTPT